MQVTQGVQSSAPGRAPGTSRPPDLPFSPPPSDAPRLSAWGPQSPSSAGTSQPGPRGGAQGLPCSSGPSAGGRGMNPDWLPGPRDPPLGEPVPRTRWMDLARRPAWLPAEERRAGGRWGPSSEEEGAQVAGQIHTSASDRRTALTQAGRCVAAGTAPRADPWHWGVSAGGRREPAGSGSRVCLFPVLAPRWRRGGKVPRAVRGDH